MIVEKGKVIEELKKLVEALEGSNAEKIRVDKGVSWVGRGKDLQLEFRDAESDRMLARFAYYSHRGLGFGTRIN